MALDPRNSLADFYIRGLQHSSFEMGPSICTQ